VSVVLFFADASQAVAEIGRTDSFAAGSGLQRLALTGMRGSAYFHDRDHEIKVDASGVRALIDDPVEGLTAAFADLASGAPAGAVTDDDRRSLALTLAATESLRTGQPVEVG
jgi:hypothetical protein